MPDWLTTNFASDADHSLSLLITRQLTAFALGCTVAGVYRFTSGRDGAQSRSLMATLVLLTVLIGMISSVIGDNIARAFSLVGALAIVRFRTIVEDTRDTAFVIFAVGVGMAVGAGYLKVPLVCIPVAAVAAYLFRPKNGAALPGSRDYILILRVGTHAGADSLVAGAFATNVESSNLTGVTTARQGAAFEKTYTIRLRPTSSPTTFVTELNTLEGVQGVELRRI